MARNVEIKARVDDMAALRKRVAALADRGPVELSQDDTFFACAEGRLKLRDFGDGRGELIAYRRADEAGPKLSDYLICATDAPAVLRETLTRALGTIGRVRKQRSVWLVGATRIHLDRVEGLGNFVEFEVVLADGEAESDGEKTARDLLRRLQIAPDGLVAGAYLDLLNTK